MTSNTYDKAKKKSNMLSQGEAKNLHQGIKDGHINTTHSQKTVTNVKSQSGTNTRAVARRREKVAVKPQALHTRIPAILGFDTREKITTITATAVNKYPIVMTLFVIVMITAMLMVLVTNAVNVNKLKQENTQMNFALEQLIERENELSLELEKRDDLRYIREIATNQYGMIDKKHITKHYISLDKESKVEVFDKEGSLPIVDSSND